MSAQEADHYALQAGGGVGEQKAVAELLEVLAGSAAEAGWD
ncbi:MAG: hypothetical protein ACJ8DU_02320 [Microvirga sp.]|jgi:hypothetical protein